MEIEFTKDGHWEIATFAEKINEETENIGARRLYTLMERVLHELSFEAPERKGEKIVIHAEYVKERLKEFQEDRDLSRYIL